MPVQFEEPASHDAPNQNAQSDVTPMTVAGLFENDLDARQALLQLRKADVPPETISIVIRVRESENGATRGQGAVARSITALGLEPLADWLMGFASVIVPDRGTFLVAGPVGATLAGDHLTEPGDGDASCAITAVMRHFGFSQDEAAYMDSRLAAGSLLAAVTAPNRALLGGASQVFAGESAVYISHAETASGVAESASRLLVSPPEVSTDGDIVVTDAVARFFRYCESGRAGREHVEMLGSHVIDPDRRDVGAIVDFIAETILDPDDGVERDEVRYVILAFGGVLGIGRHHAALPIDQIELDVNPARVRMTRDVLRRAPVYDHLAPFSRRVEREVCAYFGAVPYWSETG